MTIASTVRRYSLKSHLKNHKEEGRKVTQRRRRYKQIITSILDNDLYKFTMGQAVFGNHPNVDVEYEFINRGKTDFPAGFAENLREQVRGMAALVLQPEEADFMRKKCYYMSRAYIDYLLGFRFDPNQVTIEQNGGELKVHVKGPWYTAIFWEVPLMATISELYYRMTGAKPDSSYIARAEAKGKRLVDHGLKFSDFGTRRRFSFDVHKNVIAALIRGSQASVGSGKFVGTSNVYMAYLYDLTPIGTYAHEFPMGMSAIYGVAMANEKAMETWKNTFEGYLGTALSDTYTTKVFLPSFNSEYARLFDSSRQDSGDPIEWAITMVDHYKSVHIDPLTKTLVFSDALDVDKAIVIAEFCAGKVGCSFGIGTHFTNDVGHKALNMVIKATCFIVRGVRIYVCKLSDDPGKHTGRSDVIANTKFMLRIAA